MVIVTQVLVSINWGRIHISFPYSGIKKTQLITFICDSFLFSYLKLLVVPPLTLSREPRLVMQMPLFIVLLHVNFGDICFMICLCERECAGDELVAIHCMDHWLIIEKCHYKVQSSIFAEFSFPWFSNLYLFVMIRDPGVFMDLRVLILWVNLLQFADQRYGFSNHTLCSRLLFSVLS